MTGRTAAGLLYACTIRADGFVALSDEDPWRLGILAHVRRSDGALAMVRKAPGLRHRYEFEGRWAMPGGMVRAVPSAHARAWALARAAIAKRADAEAGLDLGSLRDHGLDERLGPLVSSYTTAAGRRSTLIVVGGYSGADRPLDPEDPSVDAAAWSPVPPDWATLAPANLLAIAHLTWSTLSLADREDARTHVRAAERLCAGWARLAGIAEPSAPWDEPATERWRRSFP